MTSLTVFYDARCGLCEAVCQWLGRQRHIVPITCTPKADDVDEIVVVGDTGERWTGDVAWVMVLWALQEDRPWAYRLASPALRPSARAMFKTLSAYRGPISCALGLAPQRGEAAAR